MPRYSLDKKNPLKGKFEGHVRFHKTPFLFNVAHCPKCLSDFPIFKSLSCLCQNGTKYRAKKVLINNIKFDSLKEGRRYSQLAFLEQKKIIQNLLLQPSFKMNIGRETLCTYRADFQYSFESYTVVEDVKGIRTPVFRLKHKLFKILFPHLTLDLI